MIRCGVVFLQLVFALGASFFFEKVQAQEQSRPSVDYHLLSQFEIDQINLIGMEDLGEGLFERMLEISPGDRLQRGKVLATEKNLLTYYRERGYRQARLVTRLVRKKTSFGILETILEFKLIKGDPVRLSRLKVVPVDSMEAPARRAFQTFLEKLENQFDLQAGEILSQTQINQGRRRVIEYLAAENYVGAKVVAIQTNPGVPINEEKASFWAEVTVVVEIGEQVTFGFIGNEALSWGELRSQVEEQRLLGLGKDYVGVIRNKLVETYKELGYPQVQIEYYTQEIPKKGARRVTFKVEEGPRVRIRSVTFDGNVLFSSDELRNTFFSKSSELVRNYIYVESDVKSAAELVVESLKEKGYLNARLITLNSLLIEEEKGRPKNSSVDLIIYLFEGEQTIVRNFDLSGVSALSDSQIKRFLAVQEGGAFNVFAFAEGLERLKREYLNKGYLDFEIENEGRDSLVVYGQGNRYADITLNVREGNQFVTGRIEIEGLGFTDEDIVQRELHFQTGEVLTQSSIEETERSLRRLGIFSNVSIRKIDDPDSSNKKIVRLVLKEADRGTLTYGPGYRNDLGIRAFGRLSYANLFGRNHTVSLNLSANRRFYFYNFGEGQAALAYNWPWFASVPNLTFRPVITAGRTQFINFSADTLTVSTTWDHEIFSSLKASFQYSLESVNQFNAIKSEDDRQMTIGSITPKLILDLRDNPLIPKSGFLAMTWLDLAMPFLGSQSVPFPIGYYRVQFRGDYYLSLSREIVWWFSFRTGYEQSLVKTRNSSDPNADPNQDAIPLIKQFTMGGTGSLRGYREQELNAQDRFIRGSLSYVNYRTQLQLPFAGDLKLAVFLDAANLLEDAYSFTDMQYGTGFGFHYNTPVGPVALDVGFKINPLPATDTYLVHFSVGVI